MPEQKHIDDFFREQMAGHSEAPPPAAWKTLEQKLDSTATPGSVVSYYKWLRYGIIIGVVILMVFVGRKVMNTQDLKPNTEKQMAVNSGQSAADHVANGNAVAGNDQTHQGTGNTAANNQGTDNAGNTQAQANNDQPTAQASLNGQKAGNGTTSDNANNAIAANQQMASAGGSSRQHNSGDKTATAANVYNNNMAQSAGAQGAGKAARITQSNNTVQQNPAAKNVATRDNQHVANAGGANAAGGHNNQYPAATNHANAAANVNNSNKVVSHSSQGGVNSNVAMNAKAVNVYNGNIAHATNNANPARHNTRNSNQEANKPAPVNHNKGNNAHEPLLSSRLKKGNIAAYPGKTTRVEYIQNDMKTVKGEQAAASQGKTRNNTRTGNADAAVNGGSDKVAGNNRVNKTNPFRIPDDNNNAASGELGSVDNKGVVANEASAKKTNPGAAANNQATAIAAAGGSQAGTNAAADTHPNAASGAMQQDESNVASDRYNATAAANWNAKQAGELSTPPSNKGNNIAAPRTEKHMRKPLLIESGIKVGYELGFQHFAANKYVIAPYIEYSKGRFGLLIQPSFKWARMNHTSNLGSTDVYYNVTNQPRLVNEVDSIFAQTLTKSRTLYYEEAHDSIVVRHHIATKSYTELEVPLLLNFKATQNLQVYGGFLMDYTSIVQIQEDRTVNSYTRDAVVRQEYSTLGPEPSMPDANSLYQYPGVAYALYSTKGYDNVTSSKLTFGYMLGVNYTIKDKYLIDVSVLQNLSNMNYIPNDKVRGVYTQPYVRISAGYKFLQGNKKKK
jgi:hypothetical protein